jgi:hypothetical protein
MEELQENSQQMTKNDQENKKNQRTGEDSQNKDGEGNAMRVSSSI